MWRGGDAVAAAAAAAAVVATVVVEMAAWLEAIAAVAIAAMAADHRVGKLLTIGPTIFLSPILYCRAPVGGAFTMVGS
jgi:hypothetical protein